jgi:hypothetical protein
MAVDIVKHPASSLENQNRSSEGAEEGFVSNVKLSQNIKMSLLTASIFPELDKHFICSWIACHPITCMSISRFQNRADLLDLLIDTSKAMFRCPIKTVFQTFASTEEHGLFHFTSSIQASSSAEEQDPSPSLWAEPNLKPNQPINCSFIALNPIPMVDSRIEVTMLRWKKDIIHHQPSFSRYVSS